LSHDASTPILRCGHCKALKPAWGKVGAALKNEKNCIVANVDADKHRDLGTRWVGLSCYINFVGLFEATGILTSPALLAHALGLR
jgi:hypothetical protein